MQTHDVKLREQAKVREAGIAGGDKLVLKDALHNQHLQSAIEEKIFKKSSGGFNGFFHATIFSMHLQTLAE